MKRRAFIPALLITLAIVLPVRADYTSIQANLIDLVTDAGYEGGRFFVFSNTSNNLTLNDPTSIGGSITDTVLELETYFDSVLPDPNPKALFVGGSVSLTFRHNGLPYELSGPISGMVLEIVGASPTQSVLHAEGLFDAFADLPGSGIWPAAGLSSIVFAPLGFQDDLSGFDWSTGTISGRTESLITFFPDDRAVPSPCALLLLAPGLALVRRHGGRTDAGGN